MSNISVKKVILVHLTAAAVTAVYVLSPIKCPVKYFLHFDCPTCGMTRAMISLLRGDIAGYVYFNPMALPFLLILLFALHARLFPFKPAVKNAVIITLSLIHICGISFKNCFLKYILLSYTV